MARKESPFTRSSVARASTGIESTPSWAPHIAAAIEPIVSVSPPMLAQSSAARQASRHQSAAHRAAVTDSLVIVPVPITS